MLGLLTSLATFSLKKPKTVAIIAVSLAVAAFGIHYKMLVGERDKLRIAEAGYKQAVTAFVAREATLQEDIRKEREAAAIALSARDAIREALDTFRITRSDQPSIEWAAQPVPNAEVERLCIALPEMTGCSAPTN